MASIEVSVSEVVDYLRMKGDFSPALRKVVERKVTAEAARGKGLSVSDDELQKGADTMRVALGLHSAQDTEEWLKSMGLTVEALEKHIETNILVNKFKDMLVRQADTKAFLQRKEVAEVVRELVFQDWVQKQLT